MITNFPNPPIGNMPGISSFEFAPYNTILTLPAIASCRITTDIIFKPGQGWLSGYSTINECVFNENSSKDGNGDIYEWEIPGFAPGTGDELASLMLEMETVRHVVRIREHNGNVRIVGLKAPLEFTAALSTGKVAGSDAKGYSFRFFAQSGKRAPVFLG